MILNYKNSTINYTVSGKGKTIVLLHGFLETLDMWNDLALILSKSNQVICVDLLGHGKTNCLGYIHSMDAMAEATFAVLDHLNVKKSHVIGHSMGGYVALAMAKMKPELFMGLCLMNSTFEADDEDKKAIRTRANEMAKTNFNNLVSMSFANLFSKESKVNYQSAYENALNIALKTTVQGYIAASEGMKIRPNYFHVFKTLKAKKLIIIGRKDPLINVEKIKTTIANTDISCEELSEGHMSHIENKSELSDILLRFVEK
ncbi:alpha/beta hydrolase [Winogradskyella eckloniae]|uniref:alpha/beta fold hydrolase n=1 Tax=Winogradskyella eckloniae TaxID=1089306 RepID=UPI00156632BD|nr:alpha/beta hydrolase [Winogradskyella eckloniae]NRD18756.1 alpha/beta hydrolase [Winogradskyella eckloniae]